MTLPTAHRSANIIPLKIVKGGLCMIGGIYSSQRCPVCGGRLVDTRRGLACPDHPGERATQFIVRFKEVLRRFGDYDAADQFLSGLRHQVTSGTYDPRDWQKDQPLGFSNLVDQWLKHREGKIRSWRKSRSHMIRAMAYFGNRNIKQIQYAQLEDFLDALPKGLSSKSRKNIFGTLHTFWAWVVNRESIDMPKFPEIRFELAWRATVDKETQSAIIDEVRRISYAVNPKIWIGIKWLSTYISIRPIELINVREGDFDLGLGVVNVRYNKERRPKTVPMLDEDINLVRSFPTGLPTLYFFRHGPRRGLPADKRHRFGKDYLYSWWKQACANLGITGVDLYGGTRHSSARALREYCSPEQIKRATMHSSNRAFERYFQLELDDVRTIYKKTKAEPPVNRKPVQPSRSNPLKLVIKNGAEGGT